MKADRKALTAVIIAHIIWGFSFMASSVALSHSAPAVMLTLRFSISLLVMLVIMAAGKVRVSLKGKPVGLFLLMGLCEPVIYFIAESSGIKYTNSSFSGMMIAVIPVITAVFSSVFLKEKLTAARMFWITLSVAGVVLISVSQTADGIIQAKGVAYLLVAMLAGSMFSILSRSISGSFTPFERTFVMMVMGSLAFGTYAAVTEGSGFAGSIAAALQDRYVLIPVIFLSVFCSVTAFFLLNYAMSYMEVSRVAAFANIAPVVSVLAGVFLLGEPFTYVHLIGIVLILTGVYMVDRTAAAE